jgi:CBS domain-containing membrane protein
MQSTRTDWLLKLLPPAATVGAAEQVRAGIAACAALAIAGALSAALMGADGWLIAPMGASAVLLFCLPASPLAQPWAVIGGNVVSALVGVACAQAIDAPLLAAALAAGLAIAAMFLLRCLHPPGGAVALTAVLAGPDVHQMGAAFALAPVALNSTLMVAAAFLFNNLSGRRYPHAQRSGQQNLHQTADAAPSARLGFNSDDLDAVLKHYGQVLDVSRDDLENIIAETEMHAYGRRFGVIDCGAIMSKDVVTLEFATELDEAWRLMRRHQVHALPVLNRARRVIGIVTQNDFLSHSGVDDLPSVSERVRRLIGRTLATHSDKPEVVGQIMSRPVVTARNDTPVAALVPLMADSGMHHIPVLDDEQRFVGIVTQSDLVAALYQSRLAWAA